MEILLLDPVIIEVAERQRKGDLDLEELKESISRIGQLHPIIIDSNNRLIAGERRLRACQELKRLVEARYFADLSPEEAAIIELEENVKRKDLIWQDKVRAVGKLHQIYVGRDPTWTMTQTASAIGFDLTTVSQFLTIYENIDDPLVVNASGWGAAKNALGRSSTRIADSIVTDLLEKSTRIFQSEEPKAPAVVVNPVSIIHGNFLEWAPKYSGPRFNLIHCDFPYGINPFAGAQGRMTQDGLYADDEFIYMDLCLALTDNLDRLLAPSGHVMFWFSMQFYQSTKTHLERAGLTVNPYPLIWTKSDNAGIAPDPNRGPRQIYETAFLAWRGERPIVRVVSNSFPHPTEKSLHPSTKPEPVLKYFLSMLVDSSTRLFDPTCGSGTALRAAEELGAERVFGMDIDPNHVENAAAALKKTRILRNIKP